jgi:hypothetical protein
MQTSIDVATIADEILALLRPALKQLTILEI